MISVVQLGRVDYAAGLRLQRQLVDLRKAGQVGDILLLLEHTPVITLGRNARAVNVLAPEEELARRGVEVFECDRGGDVTFHGPGQLVGYPIFDLRGFKSRQPADSSQFPVLSSQEDGSGVRGHGSRDSGHRSRVVGDGSREEQTAAESWLSRRGTLGAVDYVRRLEEALIRTCAEFGIATRRVQGLTGVWTDPERTAERPPVVPGQEEAKIAAIGVHISRAVTSHGFALNVNTDLSYFNLIVPCGISSKPVTSIHRELDREVELDVVAQVVSRQFGAVFGREMLWVETLDSLLGNTVGVPVKPPAELRQVQGEEETFWG